MQFSALRCLEELIDAGQIDLISERGRRSAAFSEEWTLEVVRSRITPARRGEANAFLAWRRAPINTQPELDRATAAIAARNYAHGREILQELAALAEITDHPERDALLAIIKSKIAMIGKQEEFDKPEHQRDLTKVADAYEKAAEASQLPTASRSAQHARISGFRHWFQSCAYKFKAFVLLNDERAHQDIEKVLERSAAYLRSACVEAEQATMVDAEGQFPRTHLNYLQYWHAIVDERAHLLRFARTGDKSAFEAAHNAWLRAVQIAQDMPEEKISSLTAFTRSPTSSWKKPFFEPQTPSATETGKNASGIFKNGSTISRPSTLIVFGLRKAEYVYSSHRRFSLIGGTMR